MLAGIAAPDWVRLIDKKMRLRSKTARLFTAVEDRSLACFAQGVVQHHQEDDWFHQSQAFVELNLQFAHEFRAVCRMTRVSPQFFGAYCG